MREGLKKPTVNRTGGIPTNLFSFDKFNFLWAFELSSEGLCISNFRQMNEFQAAHCGRNFPLLSQNYGVSKPVKFLLQNITFSPKCLFKAISNQIRFFPSRATYVSPVLNEKSFPNLWTKLENSYQCAAAESEKGTCINDVRRFSAIFDLSTYLPCPTIFTL